MAAQLEQDLVVRVQLRKQMTKELLIQSFRYI